jgi:hypothetical protein
LVAAVSPHEQQQQQQQQHEVYTWHYDVLNTNTQY